MSKLNWAKYVFILLLVIGITVAAALIERAMREPTTPITSQSESLLRAKATVDAAKTPSLMVTPTSMETAASTELLDEDIVSTAVARTLSAFQPPATKTSDLNSMVITSTMMAFSQMLTQTMSVAQVSPTPFIPPTAILPPTATMIPPTPILPTVKPCESFAFVADITIPDGMVIQPGQAFTKTWRLRNEGSCTWTQSWSFAYLRGDIMGAPTLVFLPHTVAPGQTVDISVPMIAPMTNGTYRGNWILRNASYIPFGTGTSVRDGVWVEIRVQSGWAPTAANPGSGSSGSTFACQYVETRYSKSTFIDTVYKVYVRNTGTATWSKNDVDLEFFSASGSNADFFIGNLGQRKDLPRNVAPGEVVEIGEWMSAITPDFFKSNKFQSVWRLLNNSEVICIFNGLGNINPNPY